MTTASTWKRCVVRPGHDEHVYSTPSIEPRTCDDLPRRPMLRSTTAPTRETFLRPLSIRQVPTDASSKYNSTQSQQLGNPSERVPSLPVNPNPRAQTSLPRHTVAGYTGLRHRRPGRVPARLKDSLARSRRKSVEELKILGGKIKNPTLGYVERDSGSRDKVGREAEDERISNPIKLHGFDWLIENTETLKQQRMEAPPLAPRLNRPQNPNDVKARREQDTAIEARMIRRRTNVKAISPKVVRQAELRPLVTWANGLSNHALSRTDKDKGKYVFCEDSRHNRLSIQQRSTIKALPKAFSPKVQRELGALNTYRLGCSTKHKPSIRRSQSAKVSNWRSVRPPSRQKPPPQALHLDFDNITLSQHHKSATPKLSREERPKTRQFNFSKYNSIPIHPAFPAASEEAFPSASEATREMDQP